MPKTTRKWEPREMRMVSEYLAEKYAGYESATRVRLGSLHPDLELPDLSEAEKNMLSVYNRWADAVVITPTTLILIEAAILPEAGDISKLEMYAMLLPQTERYKDHRDKNIVMELVVALEDPVLVLLARRHGIRVIVFCPDWIREYISTLSWRKQTPPKTAL
jgi:hypothetical protein